MTDAAGPPGPLIGSGRAADVYALDGARVLRRYKLAHSCAAEADLMRYLREAGYPVPEVFAANGPDLVMQRLYGRDMLADLASRPWRVARHARTLARLHDQLHQIAAPAGLWQFGGAPGWPPTSRAPSSRAPPGGPPADRAPRNRPTLPETVDDLIGFWLPVTASN